MNVLNTIFTAIADLLLWPFVGAPLTGLVFWAIVCGIGMTWAFGHTSNQRALRRVADQTRAQLLAVKLFKDNLGVTARCQVQLLRATGMRLAHSLPPMLVMFVPFVVILTQLALRYEHRPLLPDETALVHVELADDDAWQRYRDLALEAPDTVRIETPALRDAKQRTLTWRIATAGRDPAVLRWRLGETSVEKRLAMTDRPQRLAHVTPHRPGPDFVQRVLFPGEPALDGASPVRAIRVQYPTRSTPVLGYDLPWWATFLIVSMVTALAVRRALGVVF